MVDCGCLFHAETWNTNTFKTYCDVGLQYVNCLENNFIAENTHITLVFDNYDDPDSTMKTEQLSRYPIVSNFRKYSDLWHPKAVLG